MILSLPIVLANHETHGVCAIFKGRDGMTDATLNMSAEEARKVASSLRISADIADWRRIEQGEPETLAREKCLQL